MSFEIEQKFHVDDVTRLEQRLAELGAVADTTQEHSDSYYNHPSRDFRETREALRIRRVDGIPMITYKGPKLPGAIKARREQEWRLDPGDIDGSSTEQLLQILGFRPVAVVRKRRRPYRLPKPWNDFQVVLDEVQLLGRFAEVELLVESEAEIEPARQRIGELSDHLGLQRAEPRSYLSMLMELPTG
jgi:adenylate cyclase class 2